MAVDWIFYLNCNISWFFNQARAFVECSFPVNYSIAIFNLFLLTILLVLAHMCPKHESGLHALRRGREACFVPCYEVIIRNTVPKYCIPI